MALWDIVTGKRFKDNRLINIMGESAWATYRTLCENGLQGTLKSFGLALALTIPETGVQMFRNSKIPEFVAIGKSMNRDVLLRFASYMAWVVHNRWVGNNEEVLRSEASEEQVRALFDDMTKVRIALFPDSDVAVQAAIARHKANDESGIGDGSDRAMRRYGEEFWLTLNDLLGLPEALGDSPTNFEARFDRTAAIAGVQMYAVNVFSERFALLTGGADNALT